MRSQLICHASRPGDGRVQPGVDAGRTQATQRLKDGLDGAPRHVGSPVAAVRRRGIAKHAVVRKENPTTAEIAFDRDQNIIPIDAQRFSSYGKKDFLPAARCCIIDDDASEKAVSFEPRQAMFVADKLQRCFFGISFIPEISVGVTCVVEIIG